MRSEDGLEVQASGLPIFSSPYSKVKWFDLVLSKLGTVYWLAREKALLNALSVCRVVTESLHSLCLFTDFNRWTFLIGLLMLPGIWRVAKLDGS